MDKTICVECINVIKEKIGFSIFYYCRKHLFRTPTDCVTGEDRPVFSVYKSCDSINQNGKCKDFSPIAIEGKIKKKSKKIMWLGLGLFILVVSALIIYVCFIMPS